MGVIFHSSSDSLPSVKLLLIDGNYYVYRSFFAIRELSNSRGEPTNAIYGFVKVIRKMLRDLNPDRAAVIWDEGLPQRRMELLPTYKQQRAEMPELMRPQIAQIRDLVPLVGLASLSLPQTEADDLLATYALAAAAEGSEVVLATNDKDLFQIVSDRIQVYSTNKTDLAAPKDAFALLGPEHVEKKWGVTPAQLGDYLALIGDSADNIPGVSGIGPKRAAALIQEFGSINAALERPETITSLALREKLTEAREQIALNQQMVRLDLDLPLSIPPSKLEIRPQYEPLIAALEACEFKGLTQEVRDEATRAAAGAQQELF